MARTLDEAEQAQLLEQIAQRHPAAAAAVRRLYEHYRPRLMAFFRGRRQSIEEAEDLLQEVFIKVASRAGQFSGASVSGWVFQIARNHMVDRSRAKGAWQDVAALRSSIATAEEDEEAHGYLTPEQVMASSCALESGSDHEQALDDCVSRQFERFRGEFPDRAEAMRLAVFEGWKSEQLAEFLGRSPVATREFISQCRKKLKDFLEPCRHLMAS